MNYFELLEISPTNDANKIKAGYLKVIKKYHPDVFQKDKIFAEKKCAEINMAYQVLKNENARNTYIVSNKIKIETKKEVENNVKKSMKEQNNFSTKNNQQESKKAVNCDVKTKKENKLKLFFKKRYEGENKEKLYFDIAIITLIIIFLILLIL